MTKRLLVLLLACLAVPSRNLSSQVAPQAIGDSPHLWVGGEYSNFRSDWGARLPGIGIYGDFAVRSRYGLEGEARFLDLTTPIGLSEKSYLGGGYFTAYRWRHLSANLKFLIGAGLVTYPKQFCCYGSYFEYAPGGNVEYRLKGRWKARGDYEYQFMPSAPGAILPPGKSHGLTPSGFSGGISYEIF